MECRMWVAGKTYDLSGGRKLTPKNRGSVIRLNKIIRWGNSKSIPAYCNSCGIHGSQMKLFHMDFYNANTTLIS